MPSQLDRDATDGPWVFHGGTLWHGLARHQLIRADDLADAGDEVSANQIWDRGDPLCAGDVERDADAVFIAAARSGWPAAVAAIRRVLALADEWDAAGTVAVYESAQELAEILRRALTEDNGQ